MKLLFKKTYGNIWKCFFSPPMAYSPGHQKYFFLQPTLFGYPFWVAQECLIKLVLWRSKGRLQAFIFQWYLLKHSYKVSFLFSSNSHFCWPWSTRKWPACFSHLMVYTQMQFASFYSCLLAFKCLNSLSTNSGFPKVNGAISCIFLRWRRCKEEPAGDTLTFPSITKAEKMCIFLWFCS